MAENNTGGRDAEPTCCARGRRNWEHGGRRWRHRTGGPRASGSVRARFHTRTPQMASCACARPGTWRAICTHAVAREQELPRDDGRQRWQKDAGRCMGTRHLRNAISVDAGADESERSAALPTNVRIRGLPRRRPPAALRWAQRQKRAARRCIWARETQQRGMAVARGDRKRAVSTLPTRKRLHRQ